MKLAAIRADQDCGVLSAREAADMRIALLEYHLDQLRALRRQHLGNGD